MKQNSKHPDFKLAADIGGYISKSYCAALQKKYQDHFPGTTSSFNISKKLVQRALAAYASATGIRFMYGLQDKLNPHSVRVLLIPCLTPSLRSDITQPMIVKEGYYDHEGHLYSLNEVTQLLANFVQNMASRDTRLVYKEITRGGFFGRHSINDLIKEEQCQYIRFSFGLKEKVIQAIMEPLDDALHAYADVYMDFSRPCPPYCDPDSIDDPCLATKAVELFSEEAELNEYRHFRDQVLRKHEVGGRLYEMYYFISPLITSVLSSQLNHEKAFKEVYETKILPFKQLINANKEEEAVQFLAQAFADLAEEHEVALAV